MKLQIKNLGFVVPKIDDTHYVFGGGQVPKDILQADRNWQPFLVVAEAQSHPGFETYGCTCFNTNNALEILKKKITYSEANYSDRFTYDISETSPPGNDPHVVIEAIRNVGMILESSLPFRADINDLNTFRSMEGKDKQLFAEASGWRSKFTVMHDWVFNTNIPLDQKLKLLYECLQYSPLGVSVRAWQQRDNGLYYKNPGEIDTHWTVIVYAVPNEYWLIFDSYADESGSFLKKLEWNYDFGFAKRYYLRPVISTPQGSAVIPTISFKEKIINFIKKYI